MSEDDQIKKVKGDLVRKKYGVYDDEGNFVRDGTVTMDLLNNIDKEQDAMTKETYRELGIPTKTKSKKKKTSKNKKK